VTKSLLRKIFLVITIVTGAGFCAILWVGYAQVGEQMLLPAIMFTAIYVLVLIFEVVAALIGYKKTISTRITHWAEKNLLLAWSGLILFAISMLSLVFHLGITGR